MSAMTCAVSSVGRRRQMPWLTLGTGFPPGRGPQRTGLEGQSPPAVGDGDSPSRPSVSNAYRLNVILENDQLEMSVLEKQSRKIKIKSRGKGQAVSLR